MLQSRWLVALLVLATPVAGIATIAPTPSTELKLCEENARAGGQVSDEDWPFSWASWVVPTDPPTADGLQFYFRFTNLSDYNVPVKWHEAQIVRKTTKSREDITSTFPGLKPAKLRPTTILVGTDGAGKKQFVANVCLPRESP